MGREQNVAVDNFNTDFNYSKIHKRNHELKTKVIRIGKVCISVRDLQYKHHRGLKSWTMLISSLIIAVNSYGELSRIDIYKLQHVFAVPNSLHVSVFQCRMESERRI